MLYGSYHLLNGQFYNTHIVYDETCGHFDADLCVLL